MMRLGRWTALASFFLGIAYVIAVALGVTLGGTTKPIGDPVLAMMELLTLVGALLLVVVMAAVHEYADAEPPKLAPLPDDEPLARRAGAAVDDSDERRRYATSLERASRGTFARSGCLTWAMPIASCVVVLAAVLLGLGGAFAWAEGTSTTSPSPSQEVARPLSYPTGWTAHPVPSSVASGVVGYHFQRDQRVPGTHPLEPAHTTAAARGVGWADAGRGRVAAVRGCGSLPVGRS